MRSALITLALLSGAAHATTMIPLDLHALAARADRVVLGTVLASESRWTADHGTIYTEVTLRVERSYKGAVKEGETLVVRREGGTAGGIGMHVFGAARFDVGEQAVVFVEQRGGASYIVGMAQGKMRVEMQAGKRVVHAPDTSGISMLPTPGTTKAAPPPMRQRPLEDFEAELRSILVEKTK
jgi:hypothetical protein